MANKTIGELPEAPYIKLAKEAERRGIELVDGAITDSVSVILIGTLDIIRELKDKVDALGVSDD